MKKAINLFIIDALLALLAGCMSNHDRADNASTADGINWEDSALSVYRPLENFYNHGETDSVEAVWPAVRDFCREHKVWWVYYTAWERKAEIHAWDGGFDRAAADAEEMRRDAVSRNDGFGQAMAYLVLAQSYGIQGDFADAANHYRQAIDLYPDNANASMLFIKLYYGYSETLEQLGNLDELDRVLNQWHRALQNQPVEGPNAVSRATWHLIYYANAFTLQKALEHYDKAEQMLDSAEYYNHLGGDEPMTICQLQAYRSELENQRERFDKALVAADSSLTIAQNFDDVKVLNALWQRKAALKGLGRYQGALEDLERYALLNDSLTNADNREQLNLLNKRFEVAELQLQAEQSRRHLILAIAVVALLLVALVFYTVYTRHIRKKNRKLYEMIMQTLPQETLPQPLPIRRGGDSLEADALGVQGNYPPPSQGGAGGESFGGESLFSAICRLMSSEHLYTNADLNRDDVASRLATNGNYIADAIREATGGNTFMQFVNRYRLRHASQQLTSTDDSIEQIAFSSGFNNRQTFARIFRDEFGMSPSDFRRASQER